MFNKRINIFTGHFGSGKTEVAVNYAIKLSRELEKTAIVDLDIVNPFFRTADAKEELERRGVRVVLPMYANTNVDVPALPAEISTFLDRKEYRVVFDVGGDDLGAKALSRYRSDIEKEDYEMFFVVNTRRLMTDTREKVEEYLREVEQSSRLKVTSLVNNTNVLGFTTVEDIVRGREIIEKVSGKLNIPIAFTSGLEDIVQGQEELFNSDILPLEKLIKLPWE